MRHSCHGTTRSLFLTERVPHLLAEAQGRLHGMNAVGIV